MQINLSYLYTAFRRKLENLAKEKECEVAGEWMKSLVNHLYWCAMSTPSGNADEIKETWLSVSNHIHNVHDGHGEVFPSCEHGHLTGLERKKKWFKPSKHFNFARLRY